MDGHLGALVVLLSWIAYDMYSQSSSLSGSNQVNSAKENIYNRVNDHLNPVQKAEEKPIEEIIQDVELTVRNREKNCMVDNPLTRFAQPPQCSNLLDNNTILKKTSAAVGKPPKPIKSDKQNKLLRIVTKGEVKYVGFEEQPLTFYFITACTIFMKIYLVFFEETDPFE